jgi:hypothetical protein
MRIRKDGFPYIQDAELGDKYTNRKTGERAILSRRRAYRKDDDGYYYTKYWKVIKGKVNKNLGRVGKKKSPKKKKTPKKKKSPSSNFPLKRMSQLMLVGALGGPILSSRPDSGSFRTSISSSMTRPRVDTGWALGRRASSQRDSRTDSSQRSSRTGSSQRSSRTGRSQRSSRTGRSSSRSRSSSPGKGSTSGRDRSKFSSKGQSFTRLRPTSSSSLFSTNSNSDDNPLGMIGNLTNADVGLATLRAKKTGLESQKRLLEEKQATILGEIISNVDVSDQGEVVDLGEVLET